MMAKGTIRIGISGWTYPPWRGDFYPKGLLQKRELAYASALFPSVEINSTFYGLQTPASFARWADDTPQDFVFAVKGPRFLTHILRLRGIETPLANFMASGVLRLGSKLGPMLWQFPANFRFEPESFAAFLASLPQDGEAASALASRHDDHIKARGWLKADGVGRLRHAVEVRHQSFRDPAFIALLRRHDIALVCADAVDWPLWTDLTADFAYIRLHGSQELYASGYDDAALDHWAGLISAWAEGREAAGDQRIVPARADGSPRDVHVYFDNTMKPRAPRDALALMERLGLKPDEAAAAALVRR
ncbi:DUF72 domain-containing protein [Bosea sp. (in: a-proteobacteria)]|uniref:DUF72 domain-containing protein n=1 Tax=Bosea sp. (in: a-proteobacteria) TaxID=1871050 RepID=UPI001211F0D7|nr:DUF72 domain-containing protein [Bosea sp. (in: a-proteobacteria)]TAJ34274.1 MAG: DUF72 domain-containing protein [Bosea sp. (in: a-proteobacteria)]